MGGLFYIYAAGALSSPLVFARHLKGVVVQTRSRIHYLPKTKVIHQPKLDLHWEKHI